MDLLIAAASGSPGAVALVAVVLAAGYAVACLVWPLTAHRRCNGTGKLRSPGGRAWRRCPTCRGSGAVIRLGRRAFEGLRRSKR